VERSGNPAGDSLMQRVFLIFLNTLLLLAVAEGAARVAERFRPGGDEVAFVYSPYRMLKMQRAPWPLNREGFRAEEFSAYRGSFLIEFLGGSVCLGVGDHPGATVPERLEAALHQAGLARARVLNLCQGGATSAQELAILVEYGLALHPQAVFSFDCANDVLHPRPIGEDDAANLPYENSRLEARVDGRDALSHMALFRVAGRLSARFPAPAWERGEPVPIAAILDSYLYHLNLARTLTENSHGVYAVLLQPTLHLDKPWSAEESSMWSAARPRDGLLLTQLIHDRYTEARSAARLWAASRGATLYDLTRVFLNAPEPLYSDSVHFRGARGYELIFAELQRQGLMARLRRRYQAWETGL
jgi:hypothetical protein